jgi:hypothetical protein
MVGITFLRLLSRRTAVQGPGTLFLFLILLILITAPALCGGNGLPFPGKDSSPVSVSIPFVPNLGQMDEEVAFYTFHHGAAVFVTGKGEISYITGGGEDEWIVVRERVLDSPGAVLEGAGRTGTTVNWYRGSDPSRWRHGLPAYRSVFLNSLYENIDAGLVVRPDGVEKLFTIHPGGDVSDIRIKVKEAVSLGTNRMGELVVETPRGRVLFTRPSAYQVREGLKKEIAVSYRIEGNVYGFTVGDFDHSMPLVIDPLLASSLLGGKGNETAYTVDVYGGEVFIAGTADSADFPGTDEGAGRLGDAFVIRLDRDLTTVRAAAFIGGSLTDGARDMVVDASGVYIAGYNNSLDFPTTHGAAYAGSEISGSFVTRLDRNTLQMTASTAFYPNIFAVARGPGDVVYIGGATNDPSFLLNSESTYQKELQGGVDAFIARMTGDLQSLEAATLLGGEGSDIIYDLAVGAGGEVLASGVTNSTAFPVSDGAFDTTYNLDWEETRPWRDGFVAKLSSDLTDLMTSTYLGGGWNDSIQSLVLDGSDVIVGGNTASIDFPCGNTFGPVDGNDAFVLRFDPALSSVRSCAVFGGGEAGKGSPDTATDMVIHSQERILVTGRTDADDFPTTPGAFMERPSGPYTGGFITSFTPDLSYIEASTLVYGRNEYLHSIDLGTVGDLYVAGDAQSGGYLVTPGAVQTVHGEGDDLAVSRFSVDLTGPHIELDPAAVDFGRVSTGKRKTAAVTVYNTGGSELNIREWTFQPASPSPFTLEGSCAVIQAFDSCQVGIVFAPKKPGVAEGTLLVYSSDLFNREKKLDLRGKGSASPSIQIDKDQFFFGSVACGRTSAARQITVTNTGTGNLMIDEVSLGGSDPSSFILAASKCVAAPLPGGDRCGISLRFAPAEEGNRSAVLRIASNDPEMPVNEVSLQGIGVADIDTGERIEEDLTGIDVAEPSAGENSRRGRRFPAGRVFVLGILLLSIVLWLALKYLGKSGSSG